MIRLSSPQPSMVYEVTCPGCSKRIRAANEDERRARVLRHVRNCATLRRDAKLVPTADLPPTPADPLPTESAP